MLADSTFFGTKQMLHLKIPVMETGGVYNNSPRNQPRARQWVLRMDLRGGSTINPYLFSRPKLHKNQKFQFRARPPSI